MLQPLLDHIQSIVPKATDEDLEPYVAMFQVRTLRKRELFLRKGTICQYEGFVLEGCLRNYSINDEGNETTTRFRFENSWAGNPSSYVKQEPSMVNVEAIEVCKLLVISSENYQKMLKFSKIIQDYAFVLRGIAHEHSRYKLLELSMSAEAKYQNMLAMHPKIEARIAQRHIASYLQITPETLSRVKKKIFLALAKS